jgi:hypothetical protein
MTRTTKTIDAETLALMMKERGLDQVDTTRAGELGASAFRKGWAVTESPYGAETELHAAWTSAWEQARQIWETTGGKEADEAHQRQMAQRAEEVWNMSATPRQKLLKAKRAA